jgi:uncharacterized protein
MKCYAVSDLHGKPQRLETVRKNARELKPDVVVVAGDITSFRKVYETVGFLNQIGVPVLGIRGNTDLRSVDRALLRHPNTGSLHLFPREIGGIRIVGIGGTIPVPFRSRVCWREKKALETLADMVDASTLVVAHPPPYGIQDQVMGKHSAGSNGLLRLLKSRHPAAIICGHIHEDPGFQEFGQTVVVNCAVGKRSGGALIEYDGRQPPIVTMLQGNP